jgi:aryl-alcohol dehydrogenase-like predicted oxidoreductase
MSEQTEMFTDDFSYATLPVVNKRVFRMGVAGNYGLAAEDIGWAAERGANYWVYGAGFKKVTSGIKALIGRDRDKHVVAMLGWGFWGWQIRRSVENSLRKLNTDYLDVFKLGWLGRTSSYGSSVVETLLQLKQEGKIRAIGTSIHNRRRAGMLALDSELDLLMIRYNAKHPGAEIDIFPHLSQRNPAVVSYTALAWTQLTRPLKGLEMPPWPGGEESGVPPLTPELCYRFVLSNPAVHLVLTGPKNRKQLEQNLEAMAKGPLPPEEMDWVRQYGKLVKSRKKIDFI